MISRRTFLDGMAVTAASAAIRSTAKSYAQIMGSNDKLNFAIIGLNSRAYAHLAGMHANSSSVRVTHVCDVDTTIREKYVNKTEQVLGYKPAATKDFREILAAKDVDAITIAAPDHWHTPMAVLGVKAGKNVYVEKPCSHNPREAELIVAAQQKHGKLIQMGDQQRSSKHTIKIIGQIHDGLIGETYMAKCWYVNTRQSMGIGKPVPVPATLDWDLWQGPVPRSDYKDNIHPYNWHWLRRFGTGEALNNGTHEFDICRWALQVEHPESVNATGGRYQFKDDWQFYDTLVTSFQYSGKTISWEGRSCNGMRLYNRERGMVIHGTKGSVILDRDGYEVYDWKGKKTDEFATGHQTSTNDLLGSDQMTDDHFANFIAGIKSGEKLNSPIQVGAVSVMSLLLTNISYFVGRQLSIDTQTAHIKNDPEAMKYWDREYEKGWEVKV
ncbi:Gfo/Idh/MocA family protein [Silvibacterium acidisoli]|uniref:Gfo/Idh/MocA family protein n=1 Tax=Acidobacteriaceae bacterium ZG23-2 TaxID=2883246 RepID=UPI00406C6BCB